MTKRIINTAEIEKAVIEGIKDANFILSDEVLNIFHDMEKRENLPLSKYTINLLQENAKIAKDEMIPLCQDCGTVVIFINIGQDIELKGEFLDDVVNRGVEKAYKELYLRKSMVGDPLRRKNTENNTPAFIHTEIVAGNSLDVTIYIKGGGSENMSSLKMFKPTDTIDDICNYIEEEMKRVGPNPCPPVFLGIGIGGTADVAMINAKKALLRGASTSHSNLFYRELEIKLYNRLNKLNIGALGFGGNNTVAGVYIQEAGTHIATLPVALNFNCHSLRLKKIRL